MTLLVFLCAVSFLAANPLIPVWLSELYFEDDNWTLEIYAFEGISYNLDGYQLASNGGSAYINTDIFPNSEEVYIVTENNMQGSLFIDPSGDQILFIEPDGYVIDGFDFGVDTLVNPPYPGQSLARKRFWEEDPYSGYTAFYLLVKENQPSIGFNPFIVSTSGTFTGHVYDSLMNPVNNVCLEYSPDLGVDYDEFYTDESGCFNAHLPGLNYIFSIHLGTIVSLPDTTISIEPDSVQTYEFIFENYVHSDDHEIELPSSAYQLSNFPNPFNPTTEISFNISDFSGHNLEIQIFNSKGQKIKVIYSFPNWDLGTRKIVAWNGTDSRNKPVASGVYFYKLVSEDKELAANKMLLLK